MAATILTSEIIVNAQAAIDNYMAAAREQYSQLESIIIGLTQENFVGDAADGYLDFFRTKANPMLVNQLTEKGSMLDLLRENIQQIGDQLMGSVDPELGNLNRNPPTE